MFRIAASGGENFRKNGPEMPDIGLRSRSNGCTVPVYGQSVSGFPW